MRKKVYIRDLFELSTSVLLIKVIFRQEVNMHADKCSLITHIRKVYTHT